MSDSEPETRRLRATIAYDGTSFHGSQLQPDVRTVQGELERALGRLFDGPARIELAGRTDTGVHATAQEIAFEAPIRWEAGELARALGAVLPDDLALRRLARAAAGFHPRFGASARRYEYVLAPGAGVGPFVRDLCWAVEGPLDGDLLARSASMVEGERSFAAFAKAGQPERGTRCRVERAGWSVEVEPFLILEIVADRFLHHMVRYLVGTSVEIAGGRRPLDDMGSLLGGAEASRPVFPAPPGGLYLTGVRYGEEWNGPSGIPWLPA